MKKELNVIIFLFLFLIFFNLTSAQSAAKTPYSETNCANNLCQTTIYSYEKYFLNQQNQWEEIDENFFDCSTDSQIKFCTKNYYFNVEANNLGQITIKQNSNELTFQLTDFLNTTLNFNPKIEDGKLIYKDVILDYIDIEYKYFPQMLKENIIIKKPLEDIDQDFNIKFSKTNNNVFSIQDFIICDSNELCISPENSINDNEISITIPLSFLNYPNITYPIYIDPTIILNNNSILWNGYVKNESNTSGTFYFRKNNPNNKIFLGKLIDPSPSAITTIYSRGDIDWNISSIPDSAQIINITLSIYSDTDPTSSTSYILNVTQMTGNSNSYSDSNNSCEGNCHFYIDMQNGTVYNSSIIQTQTFVNLTLSQAIDDFENALPSDIFSTGLLTNFSLAGKELWISSRDANSANRRPKLIITHSYELHNLTYDANGNLIDGFDKKMAYDAWNKLIQINNSNTNKVVADYLYDEQGNRLRKIQYDIDAQHNNKTTYYMNWRPVDFIQTRYTNGTIINETYVYLDDKLVAMIDDAGNKFYYHPDHLGSTTLVTNQSGDVVEDITYLPYGAVYSGTGAVRFLYTGQEFDAEVELYDYGARQYDPEFMHFIQPDPIISDVYNPQDLNHYSYVRNNPYKYVDPTGKSAVEIGPTLSLTITIPGTPIGIAGQIGTGRAIAYNSNTKELQIGNYATFGGGTGVENAIGEKFSLNLISIYPEANSLKDLEGSSITAGFSGGETVTAGFDADISNDNSKLGFNPSASNPAITLGVGGGIEGHAYKTTTITSGPLSIRDMISQETSVPRTLTTYIANKITSARNNENPRNNKNNQNNNAKNYNQQSGGTYKKFFSKFFKK